MSATSVRLPPELHSALSREARRRNVARSTLALDTRENIENALRGSRPKPSPRCAELVGDLVGAVRSGRADLATDPRPFEDAVVRDAMPVSRVSSSARPTRRS